MGFLKREWKTVLLVVWIFGMTIFVFAINARISQLQRENAKMASTIDTIESVVISVDAAVADSAKKVVSIDSNVAFIVERLRRR